MSELIHSPAWAENHKFTRVQGTDDKYAVYVQVAGGELAAVPAPVAKTAFTLSTILTANEVITYEFGGAPFDVEIVNKTGHDLYYLPDIVDFSTLVSTGIPMANDSYYANTNLDELTIGNAEGGDVRIIIRTQE